VTKHHDVLGTHALALGAIRSIRIDGVDIDYRLDRRLVLASLAAMVAGASAALEVCGWGQPSAFTVCPPSACVAVHTHELGLKHTLATVEGTMTGHMGQSFLHSVRVLYADW
jgi:hypothetical protein